MSKSTGEEAMTSNISVEAAEAVAEVLEKYGFDVADDLLGEVDNLVAGYLKAYAADLAKRYT